LSTNVKTAFVAEMGRRYGTLRKLPLTQSLFELGNGKCRVYIRYSKLHPRSQTFFGLRQEDLRQLEGRAAFISFLWNGQREPLLVPFAEFEEVFAQSQPASDGQHKAQVYPREDATILYLAKTGRFNVEGYFGWLRLDEAMKGFQPYPTLTHPQIQTLLGAIGTAKNYDVWVPPSDRPGLDWTLTTRFSLVDQLPASYEAVQTIAQEIDVIWVRRGAPGLAAVYEVEHSTPIYSGLLRLNDVRLINPQIDRLTVVSNEPRRAAFVRQLDRPTFHASSLASVCTFLEYSEVYDWHRRLVPKPDPHAFAALDS
jgi:hypothetical protein